MHNEKNNKYINVKFDEVHGGNKSWHVKVYSKLVNNPSVLF